MPSVYSFGEDSPLKFEIPDKLAARYNEAVDQFLKAQRRFTQKMGRPWNPETDPIQLKWTRKQQKAWNDFAKVLKQTIEKTGPFFANDIMDDFLVKNLSNKHADVADKWGRIILGAATCGALYVLLRGL